MKLALLTSIAIISTLLTQHSVFAEGKSPRKEYLIGPAVEFGKGTSYGITGKYALSDSVSVRPIFLFGYKPTISSDNLRRSVNNAFSQTQSDTIVDTLKTGFAYGSSITYDFRSADNNLTGYIGPRLLGSITSGDGNITEGATNIPFHIDVSEYNLGLTAGADFALTPDLTAGVNATYNFYRTLKIGETETQSTGANTSFGVNFTYNF
jgi:hypothetical protein